MHLDSSRPRLTTLCTEGEELSAVKYKMFRSSHGGLISHFHISSLCVEDEGRLSAEQDPLTSNYGSVDPEGAAASDEPEANRQHRGENSQDLGWGARLYLGVLLLVGLSGLVSCLLFFPFSPAVFDILPAMFSQQRGG